MAVPETVPGTLVSSLGTSGTGASPRAFRHPHPPGRGNGHAAVRSLCSAPSHRCPKWVLAPGAGTGRDQHHGACCHHHQTLRLAMPSVWQHQLREATSTA